MVFWQVALPPAPSAVIVYVVVIPGDTDFEPEPAVTAPMPWLKEAEEAFVVVHERTEDEPFMIVEGDASKSHVGAGDGCIVTDAWQSFVPPEPDAVRVYVCVPGGRVGLKLYEPSKAYGPGTA